MKSYASHAFFPLNHNNVERPLSGSPTMVFVLFKLYQRPVSFLNPSSIPSISKRAFYSRLEDYAPVLTIAFGLQIRSMLQIVFQRFR